MGGQARTDETARVARHLPGWELLRNGRKNLRQPSNRANVPHARAISKQAADVGAAHVTSHVTPWEFTREGSDGGGAGNTISTTTARCAPRFSRTTKVPGAKQQSTAVGRELDQGGIQHSYQWYSSIQYWGL